MWAFRSGMASTAGGAVVIAGIGLVALAGYGAYRAFSDRRDRRPRVSSD